MFLNYNFVVFCKSEVGREVKTQFSPNILVVSGKKLTVHSNRCHAYFIMAQAYSKSQYLSLKHQIFKPDFLGRQQLIYVREQSKFKKKLYLTVCSITEI